MQQTQPQQQQLQRPERVLIVDDDKDWCEVAQLALEGEGIEAHVVYSGESAVDRLEHDRFDAAIVDVQMPGTDGIAVVRWLRQEHGDGMPILIATAAPRAAGVCAGLLAGADEEFFKCDSNADMVSKLRRLWKERAH